MSQSAIKFLNSYDKSDIAFFFGRQSETLELFEKVKKSPLTLLYGLSGTGKTSLVQCGLADKFNDDTWLPVFIRRGENMIKSLRSAIDQNADTLTHPDESLMVALSNLYLDRFIQIVLIFDQFEELFISNNEVEINEFISFLNDLLHSKINCRVIIIVREEYLAHFDGFEEKIPIIFDNRVRLERMRRPVIEQVIRSIAKSSGISIENEVILHKMTDNITDNKGNIELIYLQVYLDKLIRNNSQEFNAILIERIGKLGDILGDFLEEQIKIIIDKSGSKKLVWAILKNLITEDGTKKPTRITDFREFLDDSDWKKLPSLLISLEESRIIKQEYGLYELTHDSLAVKIAEHLTAKEKALFEVKQIISNAARAYKTTGALMGKEQLLYIRNYESRLNPSPEERNVIVRSQRKVKQRKVFMGSLLLGILGFFIYHSFSIAEKNSELKLRLWQGIQMQSEILIRDNDFDSAVNIYNNVNHYFNPDTIQSRIQHVRTLQRKYNQSNIFKSKIDSCENIKDFNMAINYCDSILINFPNDDLIKRKLDDFKRKEYEALKDKIVSCIGIPELHEIACRYLLQAESLKIDNEWVNTLQKEINCK
jgi:hypothetical protein